MIWLNVASFGAINWDINLFVDHLPSPDEEVTVKKISRTPGGTAANVAVASARILGKNKVAFLGALGSDDIGGEQINILKREGIIIDAIKISEGVESGQAYILIDENGRNMINTYFGANHTIDVNYINEINVKKILNNIKVLVIMDPPLEVGIATLKNYSDKVITIWDPGVYVDKGLEILKEGFKYTNIFIINEVESNILFDSTKPSQIRKKIIDINKNIKVIIKKGASGSTLINVPDNEAIDIPSVPLDKLGMHAVNTVGCGDAFIGALASYLSEGNSIIDSIKYGNCAGAYKATKYETRGSPTRSVLEDICKTASKYMIPYMYSINIK